MGIAVSDIVLIVLVVLIIYVVFLSIKIVPQSKVFVIERFGKFTRILESGLSLIVPFVDRVAFRVDILERQLPPFKMSVITEDNVEVELVATVFFRVLDAAKSVYRIRNIDLAIENTAISVVRSAAGKLELDDLQSSREAMNQEIAARLSKAAEVWGVEVTRTEILDVLVDEKTKESQRQQLNAERERRAAIARAEGDKRSVELKADAELYEAKKQAEAVKVEADAEAYAVKIKAEADAKQTELIAEAINNNGQSAINYEIMKRQVEGLSDIASSNQTKTLFIPSDITKALGTLELFLDGIVNKEVKNDNWNPLYSGNVWLIIGLTLAILELTNGTLIVFLPTGLSGLLTGLVLKLQENETLGIFLEDWAITLTFWAIISLLLSLALNFLVKKRMISKDINNYWSIENFLILMSVCCPWF